MAVTDTTLTIIEDDKVTALNLRLSLQKFGYSINAVYHSPKEMLAQTQTTPLPDMFLIDISMETNDDGLTLAQTLKERYDLPFIFLTAHSSEDIMKRAKELEPSGYIIKPFHPNTLHASIQAALSKKDNIQLRLNKNIPSGKFDVQNRLHAKANEKRKVEFGYFYTYDLDENRFYYKTNPLELKETEKEFLKLLVANIGVVLTTEEIEHYMQEHFNRPFTIGHTAFRIKTTLPSELVKNAAGIGYYIEE